MDWFYVKLLGVMIVVLAGLAIALTRLDETGCREKWSRSGMRVDYSSARGCQLEVAPGRWIPADNYRASK